MAIERERERVALAHVALHAPHVPQSVVVQSIGHNCVLHARVSLNSGQATPPLATPVTTERERVLVPPLHD